MEQATKLSVFQLLAVVGYSSLFAACQKTTVQYVAGNPEVNILQEIKDLQKSVQSLLKDVAILKADRDTLQQHVNSLTEENMVLKQQCCTTVTNNNSTNILTQVNDLKKEHRYTTLSLLDLHARTDNLNDSIIQTKLEQTKQKQNHENMNRTLNGFKTSLLRTEHEQSKLVSAISALETNMTQQIKHVQSKLASSLSALETNVSKQIIASRSKVSFTSGLFSDMTGLQSGATIKYDHLISHIGNGYNPSTGVFTSPLEGTYVFFFSTYTYTSSYSINLDIVCNGNTIVKGFAYDKNTEESASNLAVIHLSVGDRVWIKYTGGNNAVESMYAPYSSTFSGFMI